MPPRRTPIGRKLAMTAKVIAVPSTPHLPRAGSAPSSLILNALRQGQWTAQRDLARALGIESPPLTPSSDNLERTGLVFAVPRSGSAGGARRVDRGGRRRARENAGGCHRLQPTPASGPETGVHLPALDRGGARLQS